jgi:hypothetical protein
MGTMEVLMAARQKLKLWYKVSARYLFERVESDSDVAPEIVYITVAAEEFWLGRS